MFYSSATYRNLQVIYLHAGQNNYKGMIAINKEVWEKIKEKAASYEMLFIDEVDGTASDIIYMNNVLSLDISKDNPLLITPLEVRNGKDIMKTFALWIRVQHGRVFQ